MLALVELAAGVLLRLAVLRVLAAVLRVVDLRAALAGACSALLQGLAVQAPARLEVVLDPDLEVEKVEPLGPRIPPCPAPAELPSLLRVNS
eukprot:10879199-Alexandrium_andersonii.AAC.1